MIRRIQAQKQENPVLIEYLCKDCGYSEVIDKIIIKKKCPTCDYYADHIEWEGR